MLSISCPFCGARDETEFRCGGPGHIRRPEPAGEASDAQWADYLFYRENPKGIHFERWQHKHGCGLWFNVARNTRTHEIVKVYPIGDPMPEGDQL